MSTWAEFRLAAPELAAFGLSRLNRRVSYLATIRPDGSPRIHPVVVHFAESEMFVYMAPTSPKVRDLSKDPRYGLHCSVEDTNGGDGEIQISGSARLITQDADRQAMFAIAKANGFHPNESYVLFTLGVEDVLSTVYEAGTSRRVLWRNGGDR